MQQNLLVNNNIRRAVIFTLLFSFVFSFTINFTPRVSAQDNSETISQLQQKINDKNSSIKALEQEIAALQGQLQLTATEAATLQNAIKLLDTTKKELDANIALTQKKIDAASLTITSLGQSIETQKNRITTSRLALAESIKHLNESEKISPIESILATGNMSDLWRDIAENQQFQQTVASTTLELIKLTGELNDQKVQDEAKKGELVTLNGKLGDQQKIVKQNVSEKAKLLADTKNKETTYKKIVNDKVALKNALEKELLDYESQLNFAIDPNSIPHSGSGVLQWPLDKIKVTQQFGDTDFSRQNPWAYNGKGHNGVDFAASSGTAVKSAGIGTVVGTGDTDAVCPKASYGKWVLVKHTNGLSTLYAHLSLIKVSSGQSVAAGELVGYSGNTGYTTGPHLHFGVYASEGVKVMRLASKVCGGSYTLPVADLKAYLNPLLYL